MSNIVVDESKEIDSKIHNFIRLRCHKLYIIGNIVSIAGK
jgi:hypothetical protein